MPHKPGLAVAAGLIVAVWLAGSAVSVASGADQELKTYPDVAPGVPFQEGRPQPLKQRPEGRAAILRTVLDAMGFIRGVGPRETTHAINRLRWSGSGEMVEGGHSYKVDEYTCGISLHEDAAREDITAEGPDGKVHLIRVVRGDKAWDESAPGVGSRSADQLARARRLQLARTPFGVAWAIANIDPAKVRVHDPGAGRGPITLQLPIGGIATRVELDKNYRPVKVTQRIDDHEIVDQYAQFLDLAQYGVMFPTHIVETVDGHPHLSLQIDDGRVATYEVFPLPAFEHPAAVPYGSGSPSQSSSRVHRG